MAIRNRRGVEADLDRNKLLAGEFAITTSGKLIFCYDAGQTKEVATADDLRSILNSSASAYAALQQLISDLESNPSELTNILNHIGDLSILPTTDKSSLVNAVKELNSQLAAIETDYVRKDESTNGSFPLDVSGWTYLYADLPTASESNIGGYLYCTDGDGTHGAGNYRSSGTAWYFGGTGDQGYNKLSKIIATSFVYDDINNKRQNNIEYDFQYVNPDLLVSGYWNYVNGVFCVVNDSDYYHEKVENIPSGRYAVNLYTQWQSYVENIITGEIKTFNALGLTGSAGFVDINYPHNLYITARTNQNVIWFNGTSIKGYAYGKHNNADVIRVFYVGAYRKITKLIDGITEAEKYMDSILHVDEGIYDLISEFGSDYFANFTGAGSYMNGDWGIVLKNRIHIRFSENAKVVCDYTGDNAKVHQYFSAFNAGEYGFTLENANINTKKIRYAIHDDRGDATKSYRNVYKRCRVKHNSTGTPTWGSAQALGGGFGNGGDVVIEDSYFEADGYNYPVTYHNSANGGTGYRAHCVFKNNYVVGGVRFNDTGDSEEVTDVYVSGNSVNGYGIFHGKTTSTAKDNVKVYSWNNAIRS